MFNVKVWWDVELIPGVNFADEIVVQLQKAKHTIVFWSESGSKSNWLREEARLAKELGTLIQIRLDNSPLPFGFTLQHASDFSKWEGDLQDAEFLRIIDNLEIEQEAPRSSISQTIQSVHSSAVSAAWAVTQSIHTVDAYNIFIQKYPKTEFAEEARRRVSNNVETPDLGNIFISYRRQDSKALARLIYEHLKTMIDKDRIFFDVHSIPPGTIFKDRIQSRLIKCSTIIVIIGPNWVGANGLCKLWKQRIQSPQDFVRMEVEAGLKLGLRVIPLLTDMKYLPHPNRLPPSVRRICDIQAATLDLGKSYDTDIAQLTAAATNTVSVR